MKISVEQLYDVSIANDVPSSRAVMAIIEDELAKINREIIGQYRELSDGALRCLVAEKNLLEQILDLPAKAKKIIDKPN